MAGIINPGKKSTVLLSRASVPPWQKLIGAELKATMLLESMIAMIIIMLCFGIAITIFTQVTTGNKNNMSILARARINTESVKTKMEKRFIDEDIPFDEFIIRKRMLPYSSSEKIFQLHFSAITSEHKILAETDDLVYP
jgi:hypothetical protein